jgi:tetratricopeptide (TPR) repeat protein
VLDKAIELDPKYVDAWGNRGLALHKLGKYNEAIGCYDKVIGINPVLSRAWYNKARSKVKEGFIEEGLKDLKTSIKIDKGLIELSKKEKDFQGIINDEQFKEITQGFT